MKRLYRLAILPVCLLLASAPLTSCVDNNDDEAIDNLTLSFRNNWPEGVSEQAITSAVVNFKELNSGVTYTLNPIADRLGAVPVGIYDYEGTVTITATADDGTPATKTLRVVGNSVSITEPSSIRLDWFFSNPGGSLVFKEIYASGSPNATATGGLRDSYFLIYNNSDQVIYADGIGIVESAFVNERASTYEILTAENDRNRNFTAATIWVIPGNGTDYPLQPGESLKIVDQAIDWSAQVAGAINHTDADFEWYDDNAQDTNNPSVADLDKWYCYSNTIWILSNQCNRSYAIVRFPSGMTSQQYLAQYHGGYDFVHTTGVEMHNDKAYLIPNDWILDGVNLGIGETYVHGALGASVDLSYAAISDVAKDPNRFGKVFRRRVATVTADNREILMDTNDSKADFLVVMR